jgi:hypothetical protein
MNARKLYLLALTTTYTAVPSGDLTEVGFYTCTRCGSAVIEHGPNTQGRALHDLWHLMGSVQ